MEDIKKYAVIVAGGRGARMGSPIPKQFLPLMGKPMLCYAIDAFANAMPGIQLILVVPPDELSSAQIVLKSYLGGVKVTYVAGGETRYHSVQNGLGRVNNDGIVFIHDGARPVISADLIQRCYQQASSKGSAIPSIPVTESIRQVTGDSSVTVDRDHLRIMQTPQTFNTRLILPAFKQEYQPSFTDEATVLEAFGTRVHMIEGARGNIKVTTPEDMIIAEALLKSRM